MSAFAAVRWKPLPFCLWYSVLKDEKAQKPKHFYIHHLVAETVSRRIYYIELLSANCGPCAVTVFTGDECVFPTVILFQ